MNNTRKEDTEKMLEFAAAARKAAADKYHAEFKCPLCGGEAWAYYDYKEKLRASCRSCGVMMAG